RPSGSAPSPLRARSYRSGSCQGRRASLRGAPSEAGSSTPGSRWLTRNSARLTCMDPHRPQRVCRRPVGGTFRYVTGRIRPVAYVAASALDVDQLCSQEQSGVGRGGEVGRNLIRVVARVLVVLVERHGPRHLLRG